MSSTRLNIRNLHKSYAAPVLTDVNLSIGAGEIHALVGENGAGKSTLVNILTGLTVLNDGLITLNGNQYAPTSAAEAFAAGVSQAAQELSIINNLSAAENVSLRALPHRAGVIDRSTQDARAEQMMQLVGLEHVPPGTSAGSLSLAERQLLEIARALRSDPELLLLDEPTAALNEIQAKRLHDILRDKAANGMSVIYISHRLQDVLDVADKVSVLRDGRVVESGSTADYSSDDLVALMAGQPLEVRRPDSDIDVSGEVLLKADAITTPDLPFPVSLTANAGEIVGLAGLAGAGRSELLHALFGLTPLSGGAVTRHTVDAGSNVGDAATAVRSGIAFLGEDRRSMGIFPGLPVGTNMMIPGRARRRLLSVIDRKTESAEAESLIQRLVIDCRGSAQDISELSGGNQQKALIGRWLNSGADVFLLDEPTRGVDVGTKHALYALFRELAARGCALVVASSEIEELMTLCDRIVVLSDRQVAEEFSRDRYSEEAILNAAFSAFSNTAIAS